MGHIRKLRITRKDFPLANRRVSRIEEIEAHRNREAMTPKDETYSSLLPQVQSLVKGEPDTIANMANLSALLHRTFGFWGQAYTGYATSSRPRRTPFA